MSSVIAAWMLILAAASALAGARSHPAGAPTTKAAAGSQVIVSSAPVSKPGVANSSLTITFETGQPGIPAMRASTLTSLIVGTAVAVPQIVPPGGASSDPAPLYCNHAYSSPDTNGVFSIQHACGGGTSPRGNQLGGICSFAISPATEYGIACARILKPQNLQAAHTAPCDDAYHGMFNPGRDNDTIAYSHAYTFQVFVP